MVQRLPSCQQLTQLFAGITEQTFLVELGITDTRISDYLARLLSRFIHRDVIFSIRGPLGRRLDELTDMVLEAERPEHKNEERWKLFQHIGDFALFWTGVYPEMLEAKPRWKRKDALISYTEQGKRSYLIASTYCDTPTQAEHAPILRLLSDEFELCVVGLRKVREGLVEQSKGSELRFSA